MSSELPTPIVREHGGVLVVRDDLQTGGTKLRYLLDLYAAGPREIVYASPCEGGAQVSLAWAARMAGGKATIVCAARKVPHDRTLEACGLGAKIVSVRPGYLTVVQARARRYAATHGAYLLPFGADIDGAVEAIAEAARSTGAQPRTVWCAAGSGTLARGLATAWPSADLHAVAVGRAIESAEAGRATMHKAPYRFGQVAKSQPPFPSDHHYDAKAWELCVASRPTPGTLFWNVMGPPAIGA